LAPRTGSRAAVAARSSSATRALDFRRACRNCLFIANAPVVDASTTTPSRRFRSETLRSRAPSGVGDASANQEKFNRLYESLTAWAAHWSLQGFAGQQGYARLISFGQTLLSDAYIFFAYLGFIAMLVILGLPEVPAPAIRFVEPCMRAIGRNCSKQSMRSPARFADISG
jgi:hypothetical protein